MAKTAAWRLAGAAPATLSRPLTGTGWASSWDASVAASEPGAVAIASRSSCAAEVSLGGVARRCRAASTRARGSAALASRP